MHNISKLIYRNSKKSILNVFIIKYTQLPFVIYVQMKKIQLILKDNNIRKIIAYALIINIFLLSIVPSFHFHSNLYQQHLPYEIIDSPHHHSGLAKEDCPIQNFIDKFSPNSIITKLNIILIKFNNFDLFIYPIIFKSAKLYENLFPRAPPKSVFN